MSHNLTIYAGREAYQQLQDQPLQQQDIEVMLGASGGPKCFVLRGLDHYLFSELFADRQRPLHLLGSSAGAWRSACIAQADPIAALTRFYDSYSSLDYRSRQISAITRTTRQMLDAIFDQPSRCQEILDNPTRRLNLVAVRSKGLAASHNSVLSTLGVGCAMLLNTISRQAMGALYERVLFHTSPEAYWPNFTDLPSQQVTLTRDNIPAAVMASGAIPGVIEGVDDIAGAPAGRYYDGGISDYHFDLPLQPKGLILYPHFYGHMIPGWFDKFLPWRRPAPEHLARILLVAPSPSFVAQLPYGKIPDRTDFTQLDYTERQRYWQQVFSASQRLGDELGELISQQRLAQVVRPFP